VIDREYLLSYGLLGDFGRFRPVRPLDCRRGDRAVVRSPRGVEVARVLCAATPRHAHFLPNTTVGSLLRLASSEDDRLVEECRRRGLELFAAARALASDLTLPVEVLDAEVLLDGEHAVLHQVQAAACDVRPFVSALSRQFAVQITLQDLTGPVPEPHHEQEEHGCGSCGSGGCGSCGTAGGCGSCGTLTREHFAALREAMHREGRTPLL
jgi:hypothetical protein